MIHIERLYEVRVRGELKSAYDVVRWYDQGDGQVCFDASLPYQAVMTLIWDKDVVEICGLHGKMSRHIVRELAKELQLRGARKIGATRHKEEVEWQTEDML